MSLGYPQADMIIRHVDVGCNLEREGIEKHDFKGNPGPSAVAQPCNPGTLGGGGRLIT